VRKSYCERLPRCGDPPATTAFFLEAPSWLSDDLVTVLDEPEAHVVAYGVTGGNPDS
jgi:hypothetical protein